VAYPMMRLEVSEKEHQEQFEELTLLQTWGSELCLAIAGPPRVRNHLSEGCEMLPSATPRWPKGSPLFGQRCPLSWSQH
jgi:hypothetical protein